MFNLKNLIFCISFAEYLILNPMSIYCGFNPCLDQLTLIKYEIGSPDQPKITLDDFLQTDIIHMGHVTPFPSTNM